MEGFKLLELKLIENSNGVIVIVIFLMLEIDNIFFISKIVLQKLNLPLTTCQYYAGLIRHYDRPHMKRINPQKMGIYLLCYAFTRYPIVNDILIDAFKKRIVEVNALVVETQHMRINDKLISFRQFGDILDEPVAEFTGTKTLHGILGYSQEAKITISQDIPQKMTLLGMEYKVATHQGT